MGGRISIRIVFASLVLACSTLAQTLEEKLADDEARRLLFAPVADLVRDSMVEILGDEDRPVALGLIVAPDLVLTKASELPDVPVVATHDGRFVEGELVGLDADHDVAVVAVEAKGLAAAKLDERDVEPGRWVVTPASEGEVWAGVVSVRALSIHRTSAFLGVMLENLDDGAGARISQVVADSAAEAARLKTDDVVKEFGGEAVNDREQLIELIGKHAPGDEVAIKVKRGEKTEALIVKLGRRNGDARTRDAFRRRRWRPRGTIFSRKASGFKRAFQHDTLIDARDCGGPVIDLRGRVVGLNIARASRTETLAVPAGDLVALIESVRAERANKASVKPSDEGGATGDDPAPRSRKRL